MYPVWEFSIDCRQSAWSAYLSILAILQFSCLTRHRLGYWRTLECLGGAYHAPLLSSEPLVVESRARRHSKALHNTHPKLLSELKIEVTCEVKARSKVKIRRFDVLGPGDQDYRTGWLTFRQTVVKGMVKVWYEYKWHTKKTSRSSSGHKRSLYVRIGINPRPGGGLSHLRHGGGGAKMTPV